MAFYREHILPHCIHVACGGPQFSAHRSVIVPQAYGRVLDVGFGSGLNLQYYDASQVELVWGLEPSAGMRRKAAKAVAGAPFDVRLLDLPGEQIPLEDDSVDTIVLTYTLCTIPDAHAALAQMRRVLKPNGLLLFSEHGQSPDPKVQRWQDRINPLWGKLAGGCHLNRPMAQLISENGFQIEQLERGYLKHTPRFAGFNYRGVAMPQ